MSPPVLVLLATLLLALPAQAAGAAWRRPVPGAPVAAPFRFDARAPYASGGRRGIDLRARAGTLVVAACAGTVGHAGPVPRWGLGVTLRCGRLVATELGLAHAAVRRGTVVQRGAVVGVARGPVVRLGARRTGQRQGYVDPEALIAGDGAPPRLAPPAVVPWRRRPPQAAALVPAPPVVAAPAGVPLLAWLGAGVAALGAGGGLARRGRRRRAATPGAAVAPR